MLSAAAVIAAPGALAQRVDGVVSDRVAVRFVAPETGGVARPRYLMEREVAFFARIEAHNDNASLGPKEYPERYVRAATERLVARAMLASLMVQRGIEPPNLPKLADEARAELEARLGDAAALDALTKREGISSVELAAFLRDQVRAAWYIDRAITPILAVTEDSLREAFRAALHPFRHMRYDEAKPLLKRWLVAERQRAAELEFLQSARTRIKITPVQSERPSAADGGTP